MTDWGSERLSNSERVTFAQPRVGERLLAQRVAQTEGWTTLTEAELAPGQDDGIVTALIRGPLTENGIDVFAFAEAAKREDKAWVPAVCEGLGQLSASDARVPAFLCAIVNHQGEHWLQKGLGPLGRRAYHCAVSKAWIEALYLSGHSFEAFFGEIAMGHALSLAPAWAISIIQTRIERDSRVAGKLSNDKAKRAQKIAGALSPLKWVGNRRTALLALDVLQWLEDRHPLPEFNERQPVRERYDEDFVQARAMAYRYADQPKLAEVIAELDNPNPFQRALAALALFAVVVDEPDYPGLREAVLNALSKEDKGVVSVLHLAYVYAANGELGVADAIEQSGVVKDWRASLALTELGLLARQDASRVAAILPRDASLYGENRAPLVEPLAVAWTRTGIHGQSDTAHQILEAMSVPDLSVPVKEWLMFAYRGAAIAVLGRIVMDLPVCYAVYERAQSATHDLAGDTNMGLSYYNFEPLLREHGLEISAHPLAAEYQKRLNSAIKAAQTYPYTLLDKMRSNWDFRVQQICGTELALIVPHLAEPIEGAKGLEGGFPTVRACNELVRQGRNVDEALELAKETLAREQDWPNAQFNHDSEEYDRIVEERRVASQAPAEDLPTFYRGRNYAKEQGAFPVDHADAALTTLETGLGSTTPADFLFNWPSSVRDYRSALLADACRRCLAQHPITKDEARVICSDLLSFTDEPNASPRIVATHHTFDSLINAIQGEPFDVHDVPEGESLWERSLMAAHEILLLCQRKENAPSRTEIESIIAKHQAVLFDDQTTIDSDGSQVGFGHGGTVWFPPAVRVASAVAAIVSGNVETTGLFAEECIAIHSRTKTSAFEVVVNRHFASVPADYYKSSFEKAMDAALGCVSDYPQAPTAYLALTTLLLIEKRNEEALEASKRGLALPQINRSNKASLLYNQACGYALAGDAEGTKESLEQALHLRPEVTRQTQSDTDFDLVRSQEWFIKLTTFYAFFEPEEPNTV